MIEAKGMQKYLGLMFKKDSEPLLFKWNKPGLYPIHSYFCKPFVAQWYNENGRIVEERLISPNQSHILPGEPFVQLLEIPCSWREKHPICETNDTENKEQSI